jgi:hypothetical protein
MIYIKQLPPADPQRETLLREEGWMSLREPDTPGKILLFSSPLMGVSALITGAWLLFLQPSLLQGLPLEDGFSISFTLGPGTLLPLLGMVAFFALHELLHAASIPRHPGKSRTYWGITPLGLFVATEEILTKIRYLLISLLPFLLLSFLLPLLLTLTHSLTPYLAFLILLNAMGACADLLGVLLILFQVPRGALLQNVGQKTFYKVRP